MKRRKRQRLYPDNYGIVYLLIKDDDIIYVGSTQNIEQRLKAHKVKDYDYVVMIECDCLFGVEAEFIQFHNPKHNILCKVNHITGQPLKNKRDLRIFA